MRLHLVALFAVTACSSSSSGTGGSSAPCAIGELHGTWTTKYTQTNGDCGPVPDETTNFDAAQGANGCTFAAKTISADKCRIDTDFTCPTTDKKGTQHWVVVTRQTGADTLDGSGTAQLDHPLGTCRSTYDMHWQQQ